MKRLQLHPIRTLTTWVDKDRGLMWGLTVAFAVRILLLPWFSDPSNFYGYHLTASFVSQGGNPWRLIASDPALAELNPWGYPPLYLVPAVLASLLSFGNGYAFGLWIKLPLVAADMATGLLLFRSARSLGLGPAKARAVSYGYLFNPFTVLVCAIWGTNDPLAVAATMGAIYYWIRKPSNVRLSGLCLGIGIAFKLYPVIFLPLLLAGLPALRERLQYVAVAVGVPLLTAAPVLFTSPLELARTLGGFSTGVGPTGFDPALSFWWLLKHVGVPLTAGVVAAAAVVFLITLVLLGWSVWSRRMSFLQAATIAILGLFVVAPRLNQNYFLWAIPFVALTSSIAQWHRWGRRLAVWSWIPLLGTVLAYNGSGGVVGLAFWLLVSFGRTGGAGFGLPDWVLPVLLGVFVGSLVIAIASLVVKGTELSASIDAPHTTSRSRVVTNQGIAVVLAASLIGFAGAAVAVGFSHHPVWPEDFGSYRVTPDSVVVSDDFHALLLRADWKLRGTGLAELSSGSNPGLVLDTLDVNGTSWLEREVPNADIRISLTIIPIRVDVSPGVVIVYRFPESWIGVEALSSQIHRLIYFDIITNQTYPLGSVAMGSLFTMEILTSAQRIEVDFAGSTLIEPGQSPIPEIQIGHTDTVPNGGGSIAVERVDLSWTIFPGDLAPLLGPATAILGLGVLAAPIALRRPEVRQ